MEEDRVDLVECLLSVGADLSVRDSTGRSLLHHCCNVDVARLLIDRGVSPDALDSKQATPLHRAAFNGNVELTDFLLSIGANPNSRDGRGRTALYELFNGVEFRVRASFKFGEEQFLKTANILLARGADPNIPTSHSQEGRNNKLLPVRSSRKGDTPLHLAAWAGEPALVRVLLDNGADPSLRNDFGVTPLQIAVTEGHSEIARELQEAL